jgi:hypothetical protein
MSGTCAGLRREVLRPVLFVLTRTSGRRYRPGRFNDLGLNGGSAFKYLTVDDGVTLIAAQAGQQRQRGALRTGSELSCGF